MAILARASWVCLAAAVPAAAFALFAPWAINAESLGARDAGLALGLSFASAFTLIGLLYAAPALALAGIASLRADRDAALRLLAAAAVCALPLAVISLR